MLCYFVIICYCFIIINIFFQKKQFNLFMFRNVLCSSFFCFFFGGWRGGGGVDTFSLKLPSIRYQKIKIPIFEDFLKNKNLPKICFKMVFYKDHHRTITPDSNNFQRQYNIDPMPHNLFWNQESRIIKNSVRTMKEWLKPLTLRATKYRNGSDL